MTSPVAPGQTLVTNEGGKAVLDLVPGMVIQLNSNTTVVVDELLVTKTSYVTFFLMQSRKATIHVLHGSIYGCVAPTIADSILLITAGHTQITTTGNSSFYLEVADETAHMTVSSGQALIHDANSSAPVEINEGQFEYWERQSMAALGAPVLSDFDPVARAEADLACETARRLDELVARLINRLPEP